MAARHIGTLSDSTVAELVMETLVACIDHPEIEYCWGERRDTRRGETPCNASVTYRGQ